MDDRRFDALARSLASGRNRRQVLKGLFGLGGAIAATSIVPEVDAARRPTPTPKPPSCPGPQTPVNGQCVCQTPKAPGPEKCGPDCCNPAGTGATHSECCDNACCHGTCYGEELCCPYPREFCPVTGQCCPEGWTCCPEYGCIAPDQCCTADDCPFQECLAAVCPADHFCAYVDDCLSGGGECCEAPACYRSDCLGTGACGENVFDCTYGDGCCPASACYRSDCQEGGACGEEVPDCRLGQNCCDGGVCLQATGLCCTPLTCADVPEYACPASFSDGCGGFLDCSGPDVCALWDARLTCVSGNCINTTTTCYEDFSCGNTPLSNCASNAGFCLKNLSGALVCVSGTYAISNAPACGDCTNNAACAADGGDPGDICLLNAIIVSCDGCAVGQGDGCGIPITG